MSATITKTNDYGRIPSAPAFVDTFTIVPDTSYPSGGYTVGLASLLPKGVTIASTDAIVFVTSTGAPVLALRAQYNATSDKIQLVTIGSSPAEATGDQSANTIILTVFSY